MIPIPPMKLGVHPHERLVGVQLREHLLSCHDWTIAMVLARRLDHEYLLKQHLDAHNEMKH